MNASEQGPPGLARRLGPFDATMIVMGGIIGSGIFMNPYVVAQQVHSPLLILGAWLVGGLIALGGAFIYAELAFLVPAVGGQYAYIREAYHPGVAFVYGWGLLLVTQTGGMAAVSITFSRYFLELTALPLPDWLVADVTLVILTTINCLGVRAGGTVQNVLMVLKVGAIAALIIAGFSATSIQPPGSSGATEEWSPGLLTAFGAAMVPVLFSYGGWQTSSFIAGEMRNPRRHLPRGLILGVAGVVLLYCAVNYVCIRVLGPGALAATPTPASAIMRLTWGDTGARIIAVGIAISTLGFLSQSMLTAPRVYFAMAQDGLFFRSVARIHPRTHVPILAIVMQGVFTIVIALSGKYEQILNYVVSSDFIFFGLTATCLVILRRRKTGGEVPQYRVPGHPWTTLLFVAASWLIVLNTIVRYPLNSLIGIGIVCSGIPVYFFWKWRSNHA